MGSKRESEDQYSEAETTRRRDEVIRRMANTPPQHRVSPSSKKGKPSASGRGRKKPAPSGKS